MDAMLYGPAFAVQAGTNQPRTSIRPVYRAPGSHQRFWLGFDVLPNGQGGEDRDRKGRMVGSFESPQLSINALGLRAQGFSTQGRNEEWKQRTSICCGHFCAV